MINGRGNTVSGKDVYARRGGRVEKGVNNSKKDRRPKEERRESTTGGSWERQKTRNLSLRFNCSAHSKKKGKRSETC